GAAAAFSGVQIQTIGSGGMFRADDITAMLPPHDHHYAPVAAVTVENTNNYAGGRVFPFEVLREIVATGKERGVKLHFHGARLWNAVVATGIPAARWAEGFDTVSFCLSKGLGAPVGSLVCGSAEVIDRVHRIRKMLGGGMRQVGLLAAGGVYALEHHVERLADDHRNARRLAEGLIALGLTVAPPPEPNTVLFGGADVGRLWSALLERSVLVNPVNGTTFRAVTHLNVTAEDIDDALGRVGEALRGLRA